MFNRSRHNTGSTTQNVVQNPWDTVSTTASGSDPFDDDPFATYSTLPSDHGDPFGDTSPPSRELSVASRESFSDRVRGGFGAFRDKLQQTGRSAGTGDVWRVATEIGADMAPAVLDTFQTAGQAALASAGIVDRKGQFSIGGTVRTAAAIAGGRGAFVAKKAALDVARNAEVRRGVVGLGKELAGQVAARRTRDNYPSTSQSYDDDPFA